MDAVTYDTMNYYAAQEREDAIMESITDKDTVRVELEGWVPLLLQGVHNIQDSSFGYVFADVEYGVLSELEYVRDRFAATSGQKNELTDVIQQLEDEFYAQAEERYENRKYDPALL